ncbi:hypothetical protein C0J52_03887 [Blattella germanica]|nr:hypothetical protein C0J52_03887 [Blattella germanica]
MLFITGNLGLSLTVALLSYATKQLTRAPACLPGNAHRALCPLSHQLGLHDLPLNSNQKKHVGLAVVVNEVVYIAGAIPDDVLGHALTVYMQQASNLGPGVADIQVAHGHTSRHDTRLIYCHQGNIFILCVHFV